MIKMAQSGKMKPEVPFDNKIVLIPTSKQGKQTFQTADRLLTTLIKNFKH